MGRAHGGLYAETVIDWRILSVGDRWQTHSGLSALAGKVQPASWERRAHHGERAVTERRAEGPAIRWSSSPGPDWTA